MLQTAKLTPKSKVVAVSWSPTEILLRKSGKAYFGTEVPLCRIVGNVLEIDLNVAKEFGIETQIKEV